MHVFRGFSEGKAQRTAIPNAFFLELLPQIDHLGELKVILNIFHRLESVEGGFRFVRRQDLENDPSMMRSLDADPISAQAVLDESLQRLVRRGALLEARPPAAAAQDDVYFLNSPKGRAAVRAIESGQWQPVLNGMPTAPPPEAPNIFRLYEENIGPLTPLISETLGEAEDSYPAEWIEDAIRIAVQANKRTWRYVAAILERWKREGTYGRTEKLKNRPDAEAAGRKYIEGDYSDFVEH